MPNLKRNSTCLIDSAYDTASDAPPPLKKAKLLSTFGNRVKTKLKNFSFSKSIFRTKSKNKCDTIPYSGFDFVKTDTLQLNENKWTTNEKQSNNDKFTYSISTKHFAPTNNFYKSVSIELGTINLLPSSSYKNENVNNFTTFDTNFTKKVIGNSQPNKRFRKEQEVLAKNIFSM